MPIHVTTSTTQSLSNKTFVDYLSTTGIVYSAGGDSNSWNSTYSTLNAQSASNAGVSTIINSNSGSWDSTYTTVQTNSAVWSSAYTGFNAQSANNASVYSTVQANSGSWGGGGSSSPDDANLVVGLSLFL